MVNKKAISPVITTVLLIMISIAAVAIVASFVFPLFNRPGTEGECFKAVGQVSIDTSSKYTCYDVFDPTPADSTNGDAYAIVNLSVKRGAEALGIEQFIITVIGGGKSESFDIKPGIDSTGRIEMYGATSNPSDIKIPERREMMTYSLNTTNVNENLTEITRVEIAPVIKGNIFCDATDVQVIEKC